MTDEGGGGGTTHGNGGLFWRVDNLVFVSLYADQQITISGYRRESPFPYISSVDDRVFNYN